MAQSKYTVEDDVVNDSDENLHTRAGKEEGSRVGRYDGEGVVERDAQGSIVASSTARRRLEVFRFVLDEDINRYVDGSAPGNSLVGAKGVLLHRDTCVVGRCDLQG